MTIADRLREIAEEYDGHVTGHTYWEACGGCKLDRIADELDAKMNGVRGEIWAIDNGGSRDKVRMIINTTGGDPNIGRNLFLANDSGAEGQDRKNYTDTQDRESYTVDAEYLGADRE